MLIRQIWQILLIWQIWQIWQSWHTWKLERYAKFDKFNKIDKFDRFDKFFWYNKFCWFDKSDIFDKVDIIENLKDMPSFTVLNKRSYCIIGWDKNFKIYTGKYEKKGSFLPLYMILSIFLVNFKPLFHIFLYPFLKKAYTTLISGQNYLTNPIKFLLGPFFGFQQYPFESH